MLFAHIFVAVIAVFGIAAMARSMRKYAEGAYPPYTGIRDLVSRNPVGAVGGCLVVSFMVIGVCYSVTLSTRFALFAGIPLAALASWLLLLADATGWISNDD